MAQWGIGLAVVAEPYDLPKSTATSRCGSAAIIWRYVPPDPPCSVIESGEGWVAVKWGEFTVVGTYFSPAPALAEFERFLAGVGNFLSQRPTARVLVLGDFNAKSRAWGCPGTDARGRVLETWVRGLGLRCIMQGSDPTCVRQRGSSRIDVSFASPAVAQVVLEWSVLDEETLSDHLYIRMVLFSPLRGAPRHPARTGGGPPRWTLKKIDRDLVLAAADVVAWPGIPEGECQDVQGEAEWFRAVMTDISDVGMPRSGPPPAQRGVYWWRPEVEDLRRACNHARRGYGAARRRLKGRPMDEETAALHSVYSSARAALAQGIGKAKREAWRELLDGIDRDPWGRPYKTARKKFRAWAPPMTSTLDPHFLEGIIDALFPVDREEECRPPGSSVPIEWTEDMGVTDEELLRAMKRLGAKDTAPGPDGLHGKVWTLSNGALGDRLRRLFDACLSRGKFPAEWKEAQLVLLQKAGRPADQPNAYRPICLLGEAGKLFERVIVARLADHLSSTGPDLATCQYGFREGRSTVDAINHVRSLSERVVSEGGVALAVSLDIANAFNSIPWSRIREALVFHGVPLYLRQVIGDYLNDRWIQYMGRDDGAHRRRVSRGVPQGSVLGPMLWNLGYDRVLRASLPTGLSVVCYADDTLVLATGRDWCRAHALAEIGVAHIVRQISGLGLRVDLKKTEALWFHAPRLRPPLNQLRVSGVTIRIEAQMKYLGLHLDGQWSFGEHFDRLAPRIKGATNALSRLLPNVGGPGDVTRRLYTAVIRSMALYGAPVWARDLHASPHNRRMLLQMGRRIAQRAARAYRTVSAVAAHVLGGVPPFDLTAVMYGENYHRTREIRRGVGSREAKDRAIARMRLLARQSMLREWQQNLVELNDQGIAGAIRPLLLQWLDGGRGLTFYSAQMLTGHGCFGSYLCRIGREPTKVCHQCGAAVDDARHAIEVCPAFVREREALARAIGADFSLSGIVKAILDSEEKWEAFSSFSFHIMKRKEKEEDDRERDPNAGHAPKRSRRKKWEVGLPHGPSPPPSPPPTDGGADGGGQIGVAGPSGLAAPTPRRAPRRACRGAGSPPSLPPNR